MKLALSAEQETAHPFELLICGRRQFGRSRAARSDSLALMKLDSPAQSRGRGRAARVYFLWPY